MAKKIFVLHGSPDPDSITAKLAEQYVKGAKEAGAEVRYKLISDLKFDPILHKGYNKIQDLEPDLQQIQKDIEWAEHTVWVFPTWWGSVPAILKGFFDRVLLPRWAFQFTGRFTWKKLLKGRTARIISTSGQIPFLLALATGAPMDKTIKASLGFCGLKPKFTKFGPAARPTAEMVEKWLQKSYKLGLSQK